MQQQPSNLSIVKYWNCLDWNIFHITARLFDDHRRPNEQCKIKHKVSGSHFNRWVFFSSTCPCQLARADFTIFSQTIFVFFLRKSLPLIVRGTRCKKMRTNLNSNIVPRVPVPSRQLWTFTAFECYLGILWSHVIIIIIRQSANDNDKKSINDVFIR